MQVVRLGGQSTIVAMAGSDVQVRLPAGATARIRDLDEKGAGKPRMYGPFRLQAARSRSAARAR